MVNRDSSDTEAAITRYVEAIKSGDIEAVMNLFTDESVLFTPDGLLEGLEAIRGNFEVFFNNPPEYRQAIEVIRQDISGEFAYLLWKSEPSMALVAETYVVRNGKFLFNAYAYWAA
ncbi:MAG: nuclear transport factor 2 family protein [Desulfobacteraceae bacterium]|jgi:uncharacterized protein (TIGR02246 family)|nr:nuclear transport factor 2 family protein [Desulfobacteraceae bacterium]